MSKQRLSEVEREQRRARDRERLREAAEQLLSSEGWRRWVSTRSSNGLARYSINNQLLIALACPDATYVCGFRAWLQLGYQVRKGEKVIWILAPMTAKREQEAHNAAEEASEERRVFFRAVPVFDRSQVAKILGGKPTVLEPPCEPLIGDSHAHLVDPLVAFAATARVLGRVLRRSRERRADGVIRPASGSSSTLTSRPTPRSGSSCTSSPMPSGSDTANMAAARQR
jgi:N-terminal domain of anti-restriction factor ArdC